MRAMCHTCDTQTNSSCGGLFSFAPALGRITKKNTKEKSQTKSQSLSDDEIVWVLILTPFMNHQCDFADCITSLLGLPLLPAAAE